MAIRESYGITNGRMHGGGTGSYQLRDSSKLLTLQRAGNIPPQSCDVALSTGIVTLAGI